MEISVDVDRHGPLFDGRARKAVDDYLDEVKQEVAAQASADVHNILDFKIKQPTPYYETQIITERAGTDMVVHDRGIVYGPWLEGVSERNRTTRFKGYHAFRTAAQSAERKAKDLAEHVLRRFLGRMQ